MRTKLSKLSPDDRKIVGTVAKRAIVVVWVLIIAPLLSLIGGNDSVFNKFVVGWNISSYVLLAAYAIFAVGGVVWIICGLRQDGKRKKNSPSAEAWISIALIYPFLQLSSPQVFGTTAQTAVATHVVTMTVPCPLGQESNLTITATNNPALLKAIAVLGDEITPAQLETLLKTPGVTITVNDGSDPANLTMVGCVIITIIITIVIMGVTYVFVKILKRCKQIEKDREKKRKEVEDDEEALTGSSFSQALNASAESDSVSTLTAASFIDGFVEQKAQDEVGYNIRPFSFHYTVPAAGPIRLTPNFGLATMPADDYLARHGLPPDLAQEQDCFALNGAATNAVPAVSYVNGLVFINTSSANGRTLTVIQRSTDLTNWQTIRGIVAPVGAVISFGDSESSEMRSFYRVLVQ